MKAVYKLKQMGFEEPDIMDALRVCNNNESTAISDVCIPVEFYVLLRHSIK